ncbi:MAG TPA: ABC transporter ATP-binding protein [Actinomycetota bacterium]|nr:ABC transporter ATP-binding protein [Actinomycetota bacterium]
MAEPAVPAPTTVGGPVPSTGLAIEVRGLRKSYGSVQAVRGINLTVGRGEVFAMLGPNGAGKTTTVEILEGYRKADAGEIKVLGYNPAAGDRAFRERIGIVLQETGVEPFLTVEEAIQLYRGYYPHPRPTEEILSVVGLKEKRDSRVNKLSGGQKRRLDMAIGLAGDPDLLFLDEPTTGFDPSARRNAWEVVRNLASLGKTIMLTTHYMDEAEALADRAAIIVGGEIVAVGPPGTLRGSVPDATRIVFTLTDGVTPPASLGAVESGEGFKITTTEPVRALHDLTGWALSAGAELAGLDVSKPSLEEVYLDLTKGVAGTE